MTNTTSWTLITGGAKRLGADICKTLAKEGYNIVIHYNTSHHEANFLAKECIDLGINAEIIQGDFSNQNSLNTFISEYLKRFQHTKNLINNVGNYLIAPLADTSTQECLDLFQTNFHAPFALVKALMPSIIELKGNIINLGVAGIDNIKVDISSSVYCTTKSALWMLTRTLARELASFQVRVNMVSPGFLNMAVDLPKNLNVLPMKRAGKPSEVSRVITFLLSEESSYITGQNIEVAGAYGL